MQELFYGGTILTMTEPLTAEALLVEDGRILAVGDPSSLSALILPDCRRTDLGGRTLMPAFIDPHSHFVQAAASQLQLSVNGAESAEEIARRVQEFLLERQLPEDQWVMVRDYDNNLMPECQNPTLAQLDAMAPRNPMVITHKSGHMGLLNTRGLEKMGITAGTPQPEGGRIGTEDGRLTGYLEENAFISITKKLPGPGPEELVQGVRAAQQLYLSHGITTAQEGMVPRELLGAYRFLQSKGLPQIDVRLYPDTSAFGEAVKLFGREPVKQGLRVGGMKIFLDGSPQGRTAWMRRPYEGSEDYCGYGTMTDEAVIAAMTMAAEQHCQIIAHCNGDAAAEQFLRCLEKTEETYPHLRKLRPVLIHAQLMGRDQLPRAARLGAVASFFAAHVYHWGDVHIRNFGPERAGAISPAKSALECGLRFTFHQDAPVIEPDMMETIWCAVNRVTRAGKVLDEEKIPVLEALKAVTVNGAYQYFEEDSKGILAPSYRADLVILDRDPLQVPPCELRHVQVEATYKDGVCLYRRG